jgi:hypothetical protein
MKASKWGPRAILLGGIATLALAGAPLVSFGYTYASAPENNAIRNAVLAWRARHSLRCIPGERFEFTRSTISSVNRRYGYAGVSDNSCTYAFGYFVSRPSTSGERWKVVGTNADSAQPCSYFASFLPKDVIAEFGVKGVNNQGVDFGPCQPEPHPDAASSTRSCGLIAFGIGTLTRATLNVSCAEALSVMSTYVRGGCNGSSSCRRSIRGYSCTDQLVTSVVSCN